MAIETRHLVLWVIAEVEGRPNGRTYLQKMCYFVGQILGLDLGYRAHHYGPYSDLVSAEISFLVANGYAFESAKRLGMADGQGWEITRCDQLNRSFPSGEAKSLFTVLSSSLLLPFQTQ